MVLSDSSSSTQHRTQRARSMAADTRKNRDAMHGRVHHHYHSSEIDTIGSLDTPSAFFSLSTKLAHDTPEVDLYRRPTSPPLPAHPPVLPLDPKRDSKSSQRQRKEQTVLKLQLQQQQTLDKTRQDKLERKQKRDEYKQMYQNQYDYQQQVEGRRIEKRQQLSLPIYATATFSVTSSGQSNSTLTDLWSSAPTNEIYYHSSRYYHRDRPSHHTDAHYQHQHHDSLSSSTSESSSHKHLVPEDKVRSLSLKSQSTKSMYDLRPWSGTPQSPTFDYYSGYDSDDTAMSHGWDSLMDTLHSPTIPSAMNSPGLDSSFKEETDMDTMESALGNLSLNHNDNKNGHGKYLLVLGANGRTGVELVKQGLERNYRVTAFVRDDKVLLEDSTLRKNQNLLIVRGSPTCQADLDRCVEGQDVVVNVIGARLMASDTTVSSHSQVVLNNAMKKHGVRRLIVVTSYGCLGLRNYLISTKKLFSRVFMTGILKDKVLQEEIIQRDSSYLDWTIVRPITLKDGDLSEKYWVSSEELPSTGKVKVLTRRDLAHYLLGIINSTEEYHAIRSIAGKPKPTKAKPYCPFERRREAAELAKQQKEQEKEQEKKQSQQLLLLQEHQSQQQMKQLS
ncbi:hypothetical protein EDD11_009553 [Mortierella claussenii]|nr:hypothetical protein EDD11_009553 [Mortierella claussenii]